MHMLHMHVLWISHAMCTTLPVMYGMHDTDYVI